MASVPSIDAACRPTHDERARQNYASMIRKHATADMIADVRRDYEEQVAPGLGRKGETGSWRAIERAMAGRPSYRFYSAVRYNGQEMCYHAVQDAVERDLPAMIAVARTIAATDPAGGSLTLDPSLAVPRYVSQADVHLAPGCFHSEHTDDDVAQGAVVFMGGNVFGRASPHRRIEGAVAASVGHWLAHAFPDFRPRRLLDVGTTTGRNILPYRDYYPDIELHGIDVGAPSLRFGYAQASAAGVPVHFSQQNAEATDFPDGHFDLIVSSFFFHEVPLAAAKRILAENHRLLAPGGMIVHMELPPEAEVDAFANFYWNWDTANNNEPAYTIYRAQDPLALCEGAGFARGDCFSTTIPDIRSFGEARFERFLAGELPSPPHGAGGWFVFGARKEA